MLVAGLNNHAVMGPAVEERRGHFCVAKGEIGGGDDRGAFVGAADQGEEHLSAGLRGGQIAQFTEDDEVTAGQVIGQVGRLLHHGVGTSGGQVKTDVAPTFEDSQALQPALCAFRTDNRNSVFSAQLSARGFLLSSDRLSL